MAAFTTTAQKLGVNGFYNSTSGGQIGFSTATTVVTITCGALEDVVIFWHNPTDVANVTATLTASTAAQGYIASGRGNLVISTSLNSSNYGFIAGLESGWFQSTANSFILTLSTAIAVGVFERSRSKMSKDEYIKDLTGKEAPVEPEKKEDKDKKILCLLGTAYSRNKAPWDDPRCEFWGVAHCLLLGDIPKLDKVFEIHQPYIYEAEKSPYSSKPIIYHANKENANTWRKQEDITVITGQEDPNLNKVEIFPKAELIAKYKDLLPVSDSFYATNSIAYMILWALDQTINNDAYDEIRLYGIHLETDTEWQFERPCCEWWLGVFAGWQLAKGKRGVVYMPEESDILRGFHEYGYADVEVQRKKIIGKVDFYSKAVADMSNQRSVLINEVNKLANEKRMSAEDKEKMFTENIKMFQGELDNLKKEGKDKYMEIVLEKIDQRVNQLNNDIRMLDNRMASFNGAKEAHQYHLKALNA
jgi:hypothetical protein